MFKKIYPYIIIFLAVLAIVIPVLWAKINKPIKRLLVFADQPVSLIDTLTKIPGKFSISYEGKEIDQLSFVRYQILNSGNVEIRENDILIPLEISIKENKLLYVLVSEKHPENLYFFPIVDSINNKLIFSFPLMNPGDRVVVYTYFANNLSKAPTVTARIAGIKEITYIDKVSPMSTKTSSGFTPGNLSVVSLLILILGIIGFYSSRRMEKLGHIVNPILEKIDIINTQADFINWFSSLPNTIKYVPDIKSKAHTIITSSNFDASWKLFDRLSLLSLIKEKVEYKSSRVISIAALILGGCGLIFAFSWALL